MHNKSSQKSTTGWDVGAQDYRAKSCVAECPLTMTTLPRLMRTRLLRTPPMEGLVLYKFPDRGCVARSAYRQRNLRSQARKTDLGLKPLLIKAELSRGNP